MGVHVKVCWGGGTAGEVVQLRMRVTAFLTYS